MKKYIKREAITTLRVKRGGKKTTSKCILQVK
jgi:hypothetical protein